MKRILIDTSDTYLVTISDEDYELLENGDTTPDEIIENYKNTSNCIWKNGSSNYELAE